MATTDLRGSFPFLKRLDLYDTVKPYGVDFETPQVPRSNIVSQVEEVPIADIRNLSKTLTLAEDGIEVLPFHTSLRYEDFEEKSKVEELYCHEIGTLLLDHFQASSVQVFEAQVSQSLDNMMLCADAYQDQTTTLIIP